MTTDDDSSADINQRSFWFRFEFSRTITTMTLTAIDDHINHNDNDNNNSIITLISADGYLATQDWYRQFIADANMPRRILYEVLKASGDLNITPLVDLCRGKWFWICTAKAMKR